MTGLVVGGLGSLAASMFLVGVREQMVNANVALILVLFVLAGAIIGGRVAGMASALVAAMAFDFFHTKPYNTLKIANANDLVTTVLLLAVGLVVGEVAMWSQRLRDRLKDDRQEIRRLHRVADLRSAGETTDDLILLVTAEVMEALRLRDCWFEAPPFVGALPVLERTGSIETSHFRYTREGFELPRDGACLPVAGRGRLAGRFVLVPTPGAGVSPERRMIAVALADQLGAALAGQAAS